MYLFRSGTFNNYTVHFTLDKIERNICQIGSTKERKYDFLFSPAEGSIAPAHLAHYPKTLRRICSFHSSCLFVRVPLINIPLHSNHHVIPWLLVLCPAFAPSPDVFHMKDLFCDAELK